MIPDFTKSKIKNKLRLFPDYSCFSLLTFFRSGKNQVTNPNNGINAQTLYTASIPNLSAILPRTADAMPATPNAKPKKSPEIRFEDALTADAAEEKSSDLSSSAGPRGPTISQQKSLDLFFFLCLRQTAFLRATGETTAEIKHKNFVGCVEYRA